MIKPVNIYMLSRIKKLDHFKTVLWHHSQNKGKLPKNKNIEDDISALRILVDKFIEKELSVASMDGFFFSYKIPQIGKEFDLLKLTDDCCLNIELKFGTSNKNKCNDQKDQLEKNCFYLKFLQKELLLYSVNISKGSNKMTCYQYCKKDDECYKPEEVKFDEICVAVEELSGAKYCDEADDLFKPSKYLVPILNDSKKFIDGEYLLTDHQKEIRKEILEKINEGNNASNKFFYLTGKPGTGKTLLLYDLAKKLAKKGKTFVVHCGQKFPGKEEIEKNIKNLKIFLPKALNNVLPKGGPDYILVDEAHRIYKDSFNKIIENINKKDCACIFSSDPGQAMSTMETIDQCIKKFVPKGNHYELTTKVRTNKELSSFINLVMDLEFKEEEQEAPMNYSCVELNYANSEKEAKLIIECYKKKNYVFINYTKGHNGETPYLKYQKLMNCDTHSVIGQEFDKVVMLMDNTFSYDEKGKLQGKKHPTSHYIYHKLFYQGATRARQRLAIIVVENETLFEKMISIVKPTKDSKNKNCLIPALKCANNGF